MVSSRERIQRILRREAFDHIPCDFGGCSVTGMHVSVVYQLRQALNLDVPGTPVKVIDPFQMLGEIAADLVDSLGIDTLPLEGTATFFGFKKQDWKPWTTFDGTPVLVPGEFNTQPADDGRIYQYPQADHTAHPSGVMPHGGFYFDAIQRTPQPDFDDLRIEDNLEEFGLMPDDELQYLAVESKRLYEQTDKALFASFPGGGFGDLAWLPAPFLKEPKGIREYEDWFSSLLLRPDFVRAIFERQCAIALQNLSRLHDAVGDRISVLFLTGADYGTQAGPTISPKLFAELYAPFYRRLNDWIHEHTSWKVFVHSCGAVEPLIELFVQAGFDVLNPVQCSAANMDPVDLKRRYGQKIVFWGGGVDTQETLPFGTAEAVYREVSTRLKIFGDGGGYVFSAIHNVQPCTPIANLLAMFEAYQDHCQTRVVR